MGCRGWERRRRHHLGSQQAVRGGALLELLPAASAVPSASATSPSASTVHLTPPAALNILD